MGTPRLGHVSLTLTDDRVKHLMTTLPLVRQQSPLVGQIVEQMLFNDGRHALNKAFADGLFTETER